MAIEVYLGSTSADIHITVSEFKQLLDIFGGPWMVRLFRSDLYELIRIWDALPGRSTCARFNISNDTILLIEKACGAAGLQLNKYSGDGIHPTRNLPKI